MRDEDEIYFAFQPARLCPNSCATNDDRQISTTDEDTLQQVFREINCERGLQDALGRLLSPAFVARLGAVPTLTSLSATTLLFWLRSPLVLVAPSTCGGAGRVSNCARGSPSRRCQVPFPWRASTCRPSCRSDSIHLAMLRMHRGP